MCTITHYQRSLSYLLKTGTNLLVEHILQHRVNVINVVGHGYFGHSTKRKEPNMNVGNLRFKTFFLVYFGFALLVRFRLLDKDGVQGY